MASRLPPAEMEARLRAFYDKHNPHNKQNIAEIVLKYRGKEAALCAKLAKKYGVAPDLVSVSIDEQATNKIFHTQHEKVAVPAYDPDYTVLRAARSQAPVKDPMLDFHAPTFDPLKALQTRSLVPPVGGLAALDNIHKCRHVLPVTDPNYQKLVAIVPAKKPTKEKAASAQTLAPSPREPHLFEALADTYVDGPFTLLRRCFLERRRVCVVVRRVNSVRGTLRGFLKAFDKHMNLVLLDVQQQWIPPYHYAIRDRAKRLERDTGSRVPGEPLLSIADERRNRSFTTTSYAKQLFVRGDNVVMVLHDANTSSTSANTISQEKRLHPISQRR